MVSLCEGLRRRATAAPTAAASAAVAEMGLGCHFQQEAAAGHCLHPLAGLLQLPPLPGAAPPQNERSPLRHEGPQLGRRRRAAAIEAGAAAGAAGGWAPPGGVRAAGRPAAVGLDYSV